MLRKESPPFQVGEKIWLIRRNIKTSRPCDKLDYRQLGPFSILKQVNFVAYRLELPVSMKIHLVFHVSLFELHKKSNLLGRRPPSPFIKIDNYEEYEVEKVLD